MITDRFSINQILILFYFILFLDYNIIEKSKQMQNICYKFKIINFSDLKCINTSIDKLHLRRFPLTTQIFVANLKKCYFIIANVNKPFILFCFIFIPILGFGLDLRKTGALQYQT